MRLLVAGCLHNIKQDLPQSWSKKRKNPCLLVNCSLPEDRARLLILTYIKCGPVVSWSAGPFVALSALRFPKHHCFPTKSTALRRSGSICVCLPFWTFSDFWKHRRSSSSRSGRARQTENGLIRPDVCVMISCPRETE